MERFSDELQKEIDARWAKEGESRIDAYNDGLLEDMPLSKIYEEIDGNTEQ